MGEKLTIKRVKDSYIKIVLFFISKMTAIGFIKLG